MQRGCIDVCLQVTGGYFRVTFDDSREDGIFSY